MWFMTQGVVAVFVVDITNVMMRCAVAPVIVIDIGFVFVSRWLIS